MADSNKKFAAGMRPPKPTMESPYTRIRRTIAEAASKVPLGNGMLGNATSALQRHNADIRKAAGDK